MAGRAPKKPKKSSEPTQSLFEETPANTTPEATAPVVVPADFPQSWTAAMGPEFAKSYFQQLQQFVAIERTTETIFPAEADVFNAFKHTPLDQVRVVILGQDPYPTPGQGHGLCFSVRPGVVIPGSLRNIYKEMQSDLGITPVKHGYLQSWAQQGVLLLNAVLTVRSGKPASHANKGWETFTDAALRAVNALPHRVVFVLWGAYAQKKASLIDATKHTILKSAHPSPLSASNGFFGSRPFSQVNEALTASGQQPINWQLPEKPVEVS